MDTTLVPSEKKLILYPQGYKGKYASFEVGYAGDRAGIAFQFVQATLTEGAQHLQKTTKSFPVVTMSDLFTHESLTEKLKTNLAAEDRLVLTDGIEALEDFISRNGLTNPCCAEDFELTPA